MVTTLIWVLALLVAFQRVMELRLARRNYALAIKAGAREFGAAHYPAVVLLHTAWLVAWPFEAFLRGPNLDRLWWLWLGLFLLAQALRYWVIATLGKSWNTRILVIPGGSRVRRGPYRLLNHPNYVVVAIELFTAPMIFGAWMTALVATAANGCLLLFVRIPVENKALRSLR